MAVTPHSLAVTPPSPDRHLQMQMNVQIKSVVRGIDPGSFVTPDQRIAYAATQGGVCLEYE